ncbi:hypothetical protein AGMMS50239_08980 [Bacteroidia bacterium]|nr:hypothetical protein AGMMS50239_08980 [Bacteroidia bacterium]
MERLFSCAERLVSNLQNNITRFNSMMAKTMKLPGVYVTLKGEGSGKGTATDNFDLSIKQQM